MDERKKPLLSDRTYNFLKYCVQIVLPGFSTIYFLATTIFHQLSGDSVLGTLAAISLFIGVILLIGVKSYDRSDSKYDGSIDVDDQELGPKIFTLNLHSDPEDLEHKKQILFKVIVK